MILVVPARRVQYGIPMSMQVMVRRYFEQRFRKSEIVEIGFSSHSKCVVKVTKVIPCTAPDGRPSSEFIQRAQWYDIVEGWGSEVMEVRA